jgi:dihydropyrimidinase
MSSLWIRNGLLVSSTAVQHGDLILSGGKIEAMGQELEAPEGPYTELDASEKWILPGAIDPHVHMQLPTPAGNSSDDFRSGSLAALKGGTTTLFDFITPLRGQKMEAAITQRLDEASNSHCDFLLHLGISEWNAEIERELRSCVQKFNIRSVKAYLAYRRTIGISYADLKQLMAVCKELELVVCVHCEDGLRIEALQQEMLAKGITGPIGHMMSRPPETESDAVKEVIRSCFETNCQTYLVHISTATSLKLIEEAKAKGLPLYAETCPQYLLLDQTRYHLSMPQAMAYVISPPLRTRRDCDELWKGIVDGSIDTVGTDHCPFMLKGQKDRGAHDFTKIPNGTGGVELRMQLLHEFGIEKGTIKPETLVSLCSEMPARIFGLWPRKGNLMPGADADVVIWNPASKGKVTSQGLLQHCDHTIYEGLSITGSADLVIKSGMICFANEKASPEIEKGNSLHF